MGNFQLILINNFFADIKFSHSCFVSKWLTLMLKVLLQFYVIKVDKISSKQMKQIYKIYKNEVGMSSNS